MKEIDINEIRRITNEAIRKRDANSRTISDKIIRRLNDKIHCAAHMCKNSITEFVSDAECTSDTIMGNIQRYYTDHKFMISVESKRVRGIGGLDNPLSNITTGYDVTISWSNKEKESDKNIIEKRIGLL